VEEWSPHLPTYVDPQFSILTPEPHGGGGGQAEEGEDEGETEQYLGGG